MSNLYAPPQARLDDPPPPDAGWPDFADRQRIAIIINLTALPTALIGAVIQLIMLGDMAPSAFTFMLGCLLAYAAAALASVLGLWRWRRSGAARVVMGALNLLWAVALAGGALYALTLFAFNLYVAAAVLVILLFGMAPAASALAAQWGGRRGRGGAAQATGAPESGQ